MVSTLQGQYNARVAEIIGGQEFGIDAVIKREYLRGEAQSLLTSLSMPNVILGILTEEIQTDQQEINRATGISDTNSPDSISGDDTISIHTDFGGE